MSPEIRVDDQLIAIVPDRTDDHILDDGSALMINVDAINALARKSSIILQGKRVGGIRILGLTQEGTGDSDDPNRGDGLQPRVSVTLLERPIRVSYKRRETKHDHTWGGLGAVRERVYTERHPNPYWIRGNGQR